MKNKKTLIISIIVIIILFLGMMLVYNKKIEVKVENNYFEYTVGTDAFETYIEADGTIKSDNTKKVYVQKSLQVNKTYIKEGDYVKKGQLLLTFNNEDRMTIGRNIEKEKIKLYDLKRNYERYQKLYAVGGASAKELQDIEVSIRESQINISQYDSDLNDTPLEIRSPVDGTVTSLRADDNYRVNTQESLLEIEDLTNVYVSTQVPEYSVEKLSLGQKAKIMLKSSKKEYTGIVEEIGTVSSKISTETAAYVDVKIKIDAGQLDKNFVPGFKANVKIITSSKPNAVSVPRTAIGESNGNKYVWKLNGDTVKKAIITTGETNQDKFEILSGVLVGEKILEISSPMLKEGEKIKLTNKEEYIKKNKANLDDKLKNSKTDSGRRNGPRR